MKFLCIIIDLSRSQYTIETVPTLAERLRLRCERLDRARRGLSRTRSLRGLAAALLTMALGIIALLTLRLALARFIGFVLLFVILAALGELARQPVMGLSQACGELSRAAGLEIAARLVEVQLRGIYA